jgi:cytoskeletal protein RodZ
MALQNFDEEQFEPDNNMGGTGGLDLGGEEPTPEPERKPSNRNFLLAVGIMGIILILLLVFFMFFVPGYLQNQHNNQLEQAAQINAANTATAMAATAMAIQNAATATPSPTAIVVPTKTPLVVLSTSTPATASGSALSADDQATVQALQTQMAAQGGGGGTTTATPAAVSTALPTSGFADEVGLPGMLGLAAVLIAVIFLSRKLRSSIH